MKQCRNHGDVSSALFKKESNQKCLRLFPAHVLVENESKLVLLVTITNTSVNSRTLVAKIEMTKTRWVYKSVESSFSC